MEREREGGRKGNIISNEEFRHELAIIALSVYFVPGPFSLSLLYVFPSAAAVVVFVALVVSLFLVRFVRVYLYIWLIPSSLHSSQ